MGSRRGAYRSFSDIIFERRSRPPKDPAEATASHVYVLARELLKREVKPDRVEQVVHDFEDAARALTDAATAGATWGEQAEILQEFWERFELPEGDLRKRRKVRGPTDAQLIREFEALRKQVDPIVRRRKKTPADTILEELRAIAPQASKQALRDAACEPPKAATLILLGSLHHLAPHTLRNRISRAKKQS